MNAIPAVVLAGGKPKPEMLAAGIENRALLQVEGRTMLARVVEALRDAPGVGRIVVVGNVPDDPLYTRLPDRNGFVENVFAGLDAAGEGSLALLATSDIPFLTGEVVQEFIARGAVLNADLVYPFVPVEACYARYPGVRRTSLRLREGRFTGGNVILVRPAFMQSHRERIAQAYAARKSPLRLAAMLGGGITLRLLLNQTFRPGLLSVPELERAVGRLLEGTARGLRCEHPEIATDVDRPSDLEAIGAPVKKG